MSVSTSPTTHLPLEKPNTDAVDAVKYQFDVDGLRCRGCSNSLEKMLSKLKRITAAECDYDKKCLTVFAERRLHSAVIQALVIQKVTDKGFECKVKANTPSPQKSLLKRWVLGALGIGSGAALMLMMLVGASFSWPIMAGISAVSVALTLGLGLEFYKNAYKVFKSSGELNMNALFAISTLTVLLVSIGSFFVPWLPMILDSGLMILGFRHLGLAIESSIKQSVISDVRFQDYSPKTVRVRTGQDTELKLLANVQVGDVIELRAGEVLPVDGVCETESPLVYDTIDTGARIPRTVQKNEALIAGMFLAANSSSLLLRVTKLPQDSYLARFDQQIQYANHKPPLQTMAKRILQYFIPGVMLISVLSFAGVSLFFPPALALQCAVAVLVSACPCTLGMIIPLAVKLGVSKASEHGVQFKSGKALEEIGTISEKLDYVVFDLHGTLTQGNPKVLAVESLDEKLSRSEMMRLVGLLEKSSPHPTAQAISSYINQQQIVSQEGVEVEALDQSNHAGIVATINGVKYVIGSRQLLIDHHINVPNHQAELKAGDSLVYLARKNQVIGVIHLSDPLRPEAKFVVEQLKKQGKTVAMCTGADPETASRYAKELGITEVVSACRGASSSKNMKLAYIQQLKAADNTVAMIGDGPNDAPALAASDAGIAVNSGTDIGHRVSQEQAGAVIESGSIEPVLSAFEISKQTSKNIRQSLLFSFGYNFATLLLAGGALLAVGFALNPAIGAGLMILQSSLILLNAYRLKQQPLQHKQVQNEQSTQKEPSSYAQMLANSNSAEPDSKPTEEVINYAAIFRSKACKGATQYQEEPVRYNAP